MPRKPWTFHRPIYQPEWCDDWLYTRDGFVRYAWHERVSICMESGASLREACDVAGDDFRRELSIELWRPGKG